MYFKLTSIILWSLITPAIANNAIYVETPQTDLIISQLYGILNTQPQQDMHSRITQISARFLGKPYQLGALGEGSKSEFDQAPLYRVDAFDCETYVDTVLALALANNSMTFKQCIRHVRYQDGKVSFINRNHFTCLDWNKHNQQNKYLKDITTTILDKSHRPVALWAQALIDKPSWYQHFSEEHIRLIKTSPAKVKQRLTRLKQRARLLPRKISRIAYLPLSVLFDKNGKPNEYLFKQIPQASIIEIIRPNWDLNEKIGTHLNVSHLGFAIWKHNILMFREASSMQQQVIETPLIDYLREAIKSPTIKGINVQIILPQQPLTGHCKIISKAKTTPL